MCVVRNNRLSGVINKAKLSDFSERYGKNLGRKIRNKVGNKLISCKQRGIDFCISWEVLDLLVDKWILQKGICDYTGEEFVKGVGKPNTATLERINSQLPYQEGNLCVIVKKVNDYKGLMENPNSKSFTAKEGSVELFKVILQSISNLDKMIEIRNQYIPSKQLNETKVQTNEIKMEKPMQELTTNNFVEKKEAHEDVVYATRYANFMKYLIEQGKEVTISFPQFKHLLKRKNCFLSGNKFESDDEKIPVLLSDEVGKDTLVFAFEKYANPFQALINQEGMTITLLKNMLGKNLK